MKKALENKRLTSRYSGSLLGLAVGDALGVAVEGYERGSFEKVTEITGRPSWELPAGCWTDDTSMALCLADSLIVCNGFDPMDQMKRYVKWYREGYRSSIGRCFDIGVATYKALDRFEESENHYAGDIDPRTAGNGSLMRLAPIAIYFYPDRNRMIEYASLSSKTTHGATECLEACELFASVLFWAFEGESKDKLLNQSSMKFLSPKIKAIADGDYLDWEPNDCASTGYVLDSLQAALCCFNSTDSFEEALITAVNLGGDADTIAAITGQIAGAYYGVEEIPKRWLEKLHQRDEIQILAAQLSAS